MANLADLLKTAMTLEVQDRAALAERLLASMKELGEGGAERLWAAEAQRRLDGYLSGKAKAIPAEEVHRKAERLLR